MVSHSDLGATLASTGLDKDFLSAPKPSGRRRRESLPPGTNLTVLNPDLKHVLCMETGEVLSVEQVIGSDYAQLVKLRMSIRSAKKPPRYVCAMCGVSVFIFCAPSGIRFSFKHHRHESNCPAQTKLGLSQVEINAIRYNGAKESKLHLKMKKWLQACLAADGRFESIEEEPRWSDTFTSKWRRPDVRAVYNGIPIAFEVQLSTTYLNVIAERRDFYLEQGGLLFWIFAEFDCELRRMTEDDVFYNNNQNAFIVNAATVEASLLSEEFFLECVWAQPLRNGSTSGFHRKQVSFHDLVLDPDKQQAYFYDFEGEKARFAFEAGMEAETLRREFEAWWNRNRDGYEKVAPAWTAFRERFRKQHVSIPLYLNSFDYSVLTCLYSAKHNKPWGSRQSKLVEVAHRVAGAHKRHLIWFMHAVKHYGNLESMCSEGDPDKWKRRHAGCVAEYRDLETRDLYRPKEDLLPIVEFLFPELCPFPMGNFDVIPE